MGLQEVAISCPQTGVVVTCAIVSSQNILSILLEVTGTKRLVINITLKAVAILSIYETDIIFKQVCKLYCLIALVK